MSVTTKESPGRGPGRSGDDGRSERRRPLTRVFDRFATAATRAAGSPYAFGGAVVAIVVWLVSGPLFHYSDAWQLVVNTGTTIITFLMVFLLQQSQNKDSVAMHLKLDELLSSQHAASNALIGIENASEEELRRLAATWLELASRRQTEGDTESDTHDGASGEPADEDDAAGKRNGPGA